MFDKIKTLEQKETKKIKQTTFGNDLDDSESLEIVDVTNIISSLNAEIKTVKQNEKNSTISMVYSSNENKSKSVVSSCNCFG